MSSCPRILFCGAGWPTNMGNSFIDLGAMALLRSALPEAKIAFASEMPRWFFAHGRHRRLGLRRGMKDYGMDNALNLASLVDCDMAVFAGMSLCDAFIQLNGPTALALSKRGVPILFMGAGAEKYTDEERTDFGGFLRQLKPVGFVSRDDVSYAAFAPFVSNSFKGIDCGFFVPEAYAPFPLCLPPYVVAAFDNHDEPPLDAGGRDILRAHHCCWGPAEARYLTRGSLISDVPYDYLTLYANAAEVHTDRVHACVATLAYGRRARLYDSTPRGSLLVAAGAARIREDVVALDMDALTIKKTAQVQFVRQVIANHVRA